MHPPSRLTIEADYQTIAYLAARAQHRRQVAASLTFACTSDPSPNKNVLKLASEGTADVIVSAQLPFFVTPEALSDGLAKLGVKAETVREVVGQVAAANAVKPAREQVRDGQAAQLLTSHLVASPYIRGVNIRPTAEAADPTPERGPDPTVDARPPAHESPVSEDDWPVLPTASEVV